MTTTPTSRRMPPWAIVAKREIFVRLTDRAFWIGTLSTIGLLIVAFAASFLFQGGGGSTTPVAVADDDAAGVIAMAAAAGHNVEALRVDESELRAAVLDDRASAALHRVADGWELLIEPRMGMADGPQLDEAVRAWQIQRNAEALGVDPAAVLADTVLTMAPLSPDNTGAAVFVATLAFAVLFLMAAMTYGMQIAQSVVTEKESRIVEILAATIPIRQLLIGKVVGNTIMALGQVILFVAVALIGLTFTQYRALIGMVVPVAGWFILFFLVGFAALACLWAAAGAMATRTQDLSQTTTPLTMLIMFVYMAGLLASGTFAKVASYLPIVSTVMMPGRLFSGEASWVDALLALAVAVGFMALAITFGSNIYRRGLLQTGSVLSLRQALRLKDA